MFQYEIAVIGAGADYKPALEYCQNFNLVEFEKPARGASITIAHRKQTYAKRWKIRVQNKHLQVKDIPLLDTEISLTCYDKLERVYSPTNLAVVVTDRVPDQPEHLAWIKQLQEQKVETLGAFSYENVPDDFDDEFRSDISWTSYEGSLDMIFLKIADLLGGEISFLYDE